MLRFAADENFNNNIVRGLRRERPDVDIVRIQDVGLTSADDPDVLEWAAKDGRLVLTHDASTMTHFAYERVRAQKAMPGLIEIRRGVPISQVINDLILLAECSEDNEWARQIIYLPLR